MLPEKTRSIILVLISTIGTVLVTLGLFNLNAEDIDQLKDLLINLEASISVVIGVLIELYAWFSARKGKSVETTETAIYQPSKFIGIIPAI